jgi:hypothetical protein
VSPKIGISVALRGWRRATRTPTAKVNAALIRMRGQHIELRYGDHGVLPCPFAGGWCLDRMAVPRGVNIIGAVLLAFQPEAAGDDPQAAAAEALEVSAAWVEGLADGWDCEPQSQVLLSGSGRGDYRQGYEAGMEARFRATVVCPDCGARRFRTIPSCGGC